MRIVAQRVKQARVEVGAEVTGAIGQGLVILLGVEKGDTEADADYMVEKTIGLRVFPDQAGKMNLSVVDAGGALLVISQFTLYGDCRKGKRPSFDRAAGPDEASRLYHYFVARTRAAGLPVQTGIFQAHMDVHLVNDGPVTLVYDSPKSI